MTTPLPLHQPLAQPGDLATEAPQLDGDACDAIARWAVHAASMAQAPEWRRQGQRWIDNKEAGAVAHLAQALLLEALRETEDSRRQLLVLCDRLSQAAGWEAVRWIARHILRQTEAAPAARWLVRAAEESGSADDVFQALEEAHEKAPGDAQLGWRLAQEFEKRGDHETALRVTAEALEAMMDRKDLSSLDEIFLFLLEEPRAETLRLLLPAFPLLARGGAAKLAEYLEVALPAILELGLAPECWKMVRDALLHVDDAKPIVRHLPKLVEAAYPQGAEAVRVLEFSGLLDGAPPREALQAFDRTLPYAAGSFVEHATWGAGRVSQLDREELWIDFPHRSGHRMTLRAARQALTPVSADDLVVLASLQPEELARRRAEDPVDLVRRALLRLKGEAELPAIKRVLVHYALPDKEWSKFWKTAKAKLETDPRIDASEAYRKIYRLAPEGEAAESAAAPHFDRGADPGPSLALLQRFLAQHPEQLPALLERNRSTLAHWRDDDQLAWRQRFDAAALLDLSGEPEARAGAEAVAAEAFQSGFDVRELPNTEDQARVLRWGLTTPAWAEAARSAFGSRFAEIRDEGLTNALQRHGESAVGFLEETARGTRRWPDAGLQVALWAYGPKGRPEGLPALSAWDVAVGLAELLESGPSAAQARSAVSVLQAKGPLAEAGRTEAPPDDRVRHMRRLLTHWRSSDRHLHPLLEWLEATGHTEIAEETRTRKRQAARAVTASAERSSPYEIPQVYCTRATYDALRREAEEVQQALRTTIPAAIQKARELGDLRENAEYESARLKQRTAQARLEQLAQRMERTLFIEDLDEEPGRIGIGSEVELTTEGGDTLRYWILGEGDAGHGPEVVSYLAPIGRALFERAVGETVELPGDGGSVRATVRAIRHRLPAGGAASQVEN